MPPAARACYGRAPPRKITNSGAILAQVTCHRLPPSSCLHNGGAWPARLGLPADRHEVVHANALHNEKLARAISRAVHVVRRHHVGTR